MAKFSTVLIGGGTGFVGSYLAEGFRNVASKVLIVSRMPGVGRISWNDLQQKGLPEETEVVVNVAGQNVLDPMRRWTPGFRQNVVSSRVLTTKTLAEAIEKSSKPPKVFITMSGVGYYPPNETAEYNEESNPAASDFFSQLCHDWEKSGNLSDQIPTRRVIIRSGVVLGSEGGIIQRVYIPFFLGLGGPIGSGNQFFPWIHIDDLVNMFLFAASNEKVVGVLNGVAPQVVTNKEFSKALGSAMFRPSFIPLPEKVIELAFGKERASMMTEGQKVIPKRVLDYGFNYKFPDIASACKNIVN